MDALALMLLLAAVYVAGLLTGSGLTNSKWEKNWRVPMRIVYGGSFFKVVRLDRQYESMKNLDIHLENK